MTTSQELTIYIVRHGQTVFNLTDKVQGFSNSPLTDLGIKQAQDLGEKIKDIKFVSAYTSDLGRQKETIKKILSQNQNPIPPLKELYGLREWNFGGFEGGENSAMWGGVLKVYGIKYENMDDGSEKFKKLLKEIGDRKFCDAIFAADSSERSEKYDAIIERATEAMNTIVLDAQKSDENDKNILVVSSGCVIRTILYTLVPKQYLGGEIANCSVSILKYKDGEFVLS